MPDHDYNEDYSDSLDRPSKTQQKAAMHALRDLGSELVELSPGQLKRMVAAYLGYSSTGDLRLKTITIQPDGVKRADHYRLLAQPGAPREARIKVGQGLRSVYWGFEVEAIGGAAFAIDLIELQPIVVEQRIQGQGGGKR